MLSMLTVQGNDFSQISLFTTDKYRHLDLRTNRDFSSIPFPISDKKAPTENFSVTNRRLA